MATTTSTHTYTRTHTATYLADVILGAIGDILASLGISSSSLYSDWAQDEAAIAAWIAEESLKAVVVECTQPNGKVAPIFEFPVSYETSGRADTAFVNSRAALARYRAKLDAVPNGTRFRLICTYNGAHSDQPGWTPTTRASTAGLTALSFGSLAEGPHASASLRYLR